MTSDPPKRGQLYFADLEDIGRKLVLVISSDEVNAVLGQPVVCFATATERERTLDTYVLIDPPEGGVWRRTTILCHGVVTIERWRLADEPIGTVSSSTMTLVGDKLKSVFELVEVAAPEEERTDAGARTEESGAGDDSASSG